jgi:hypothetical protein
MLRLSLIALLTVLAPSANAQRMLSASPRFGGPHFNRSGHPRTFAYPLGFSEPFYYDYVKTEIPAPPVVSLQRPETRVSASDFPSPAQPLMIELRGDQYVRLSGTETSSAQIIDPAVTLASKSTSMSRTASHVVNEAPLPIVVLHFHDGHREETTSYTITDGVLYINASPYTVGPWIRKIELTSLNLPETINSNQSRGIRFHVPSAPNEVVVGP